MINLHAIPALTLPDGPTQGDLRLPKSSWDKDEPFEPDQNAQPIGAIEANAPSRATKKWKIRLRISAVGFLATLVLMLVISPFVRNLREGQLYESVLFTMVMCTGLIASGSCRKLAFALASLALTATWMNQFWPQKYSALTFILPAIGFLVIVIASLLRFVLRAKRVDAEVLCAGISVYLILGLLWGLAYTFVAQVSPDAFSFNARSGPLKVMSGFTAMYFSFTTLMTVGYGDITPVADVARMLASLEAMTGTLFVGVMIAHLVSLYSATRYHRPAHRGVQNNNP